MIESLFSILSKYKPLEKISPEENYSTELFVYLLRYSQSNKTKLLSSFMELLGIEKNTYDYENIKLNTQNTFYTKDNRKVVSDITIQMENSDIFIEAKVESDINYYEDESEKNIRKMRSQIQQYQRIYTQKDKKDKKIYLLTKYNCDLSFTNCPDFKNKIRWQDIYLILKNYESTDEIEGFLVKETIKYFEEKKMSIQKVSFELVKGMESFNNLLAQLVLSLEKIPHRASHSSVFIGYFVDSNKKELLGWVGITFDGCKLAFEYYNDNAVRIIKLKYAKEYIQNRPGRFEKHFNFEENHYFCLKPEEQLKTIKKWVEENYNRLVKFSTKKNK